ncbi:hypothetical protein [Sphingomonas bacterium]|uniref:hypothetical protein n=1 Tax=Sphingomonas bacterium TaxID=1895847 RepID=UPI001575581B|nr:hypothetical protein [Sphingomonas bacterium]
MAILLLQVSAAAPLPPIAFDLAKAKPPIRRCGSGTEAEIVVCGRSDPDRYRVKPIQDSYSDKPIVAEAKLGGGKLQAHGMKSPIPGAPGRAMLTFTTTF